MLLGKKLLLGTITPYMFIFPFVSSSGRRQTFTDYYVTKDGASITAGAFPVARVWFRPCYAHGMYLTVCYENSVTEVYASGDGLSWTQLTTLPGMNPSQLLLAGEWFYLFESVGPIMRSKDGVTWTSVGTCPISITSAAGSIDYHDGVFVAASSENFSAKIRYSTDGGATWVDAATPPPYAPQYGNVSCGGAWAIKDGFLVTYSNSGTRPGQSITVSGGSSVAFYSADGSVWTSTSVQSVAMLFSNGNTAFYTATASDGTSSGAMTSDGTTWTTFLFTTTMWRNISVGGNNRFLCQASWNNSNLTLSTIELSTGSTYQYTFQNITTAHQITRRSTW